jgi:hypothetical protein
MLNVKKTLECWNKAFLGSCKLTILTLDEANKVVYEQGKSVYAIYLKGLKYEDRDAHITLTPGPDDTSEWDHCHFTVTRKDSHHVFYEVEDNGDIDVVQELVGEGKKGEGKLKKAKEHNAKNVVINDPKLSNAIKADMEQICTWLSTHKWEKAG